MTRRVVLPHLLRLAAATALLPALACGGGSGAADQASDAGASPAASPDVGATASASADGSGGDAEDESGSTAGAPRPATVTAGGSTWRFAMAMCDTDGQATLLVSGTDDAGVLLVVDVTDGAGEVYVSDGDAVEDLLLGTTQDLALQQDGSFTATGSGSTPDGEQSFTLERDCALDG